MIHTNKTGKNVRRLHSVSGIAISDQSVKALIFKVNEEMLNKMKCCAAASEANDYTRNVT
jgi:hypothetical protein